MVVEKRAEKRKQPTGNSVPEVKKRKSKVLSKKEQKTLVQSLDSIDTSILLAAVTDYLKEQHLSAKLKGFIDVLLQNNQPVAERVLHHRKCFSLLYTECKKEPDSMLKFQLRWHKHCSTFLLSQSYSLATIGFEELPQCPVGPLRQVWIDFCNSNNVPIPESNSIMISLSSVIYNFLLEHVATYQQGLTASSLSGISEQDSDDVYFRFGGAALCDMLHLHYQKIRCCSAEQRDLLSQEIGILQAINTKDKSKIPKYLQYRDRGYTYFPDDSFILFLRDIDTVVKEIVNQDGLEQNGADLVKVKNHRNKCCTCLTFLLYLFSGST